MQILKGRWGPFITDGKKNARMPKDREPESMTLEECLALLEAAPDKRSRKKGGQKESGKEESGKKKAAKKKTARKKAPERKQSRAKTADDQGKSRARSLPTDHPQAAHACSAGESLPIPPRQFTAWAAIPAMKRPCADCCL